MRLCMSLIESLLAVPVLERRKGEGWDDFSLECWDTEPGGEECLLVTEGKALKGGLSPTQRVLCAGRAESCEGGLLLAVELPLPELLGRVNRLFHRFDILEKRMDEAVYVSHSIQELTECMAPLFDGDLSVCTPDFRVLGQGGSDKLLRDSRLPDPEPDGTLPEEIAGVFRDDSRFVGYRELREPFIYERGLYAYDLLCVNVFYQGASVCRITHSSANGPFRSYDGGLLQYFGDYVRRAYEASGVADARLPRSRMQQAAEALLEGRELTAEALSAALLAQGWTEDAPLLCLCLLPSAQSWPENAFPYYCRMIGRVLQGCCVFEREEHLLCLVELTRWGGSTAGFMEQVVEFFRDNHFLAGLSNEFSELSELPSAWRQATVALQVGLRTNPTFWYHRFADRALTYIIERSAGELDAEHVCAPQLLLLRRHDAEHGSEYYETLRVYLRQAMNAVQTAKALFIHRGTLLYRLGRIRELTGLTLEDADERLYLEFSYKMLE